MTCKEGYFNIYYSDCKYRDSGPWISQDCYKFVVEGCAAHCVCVVWRLMTDENMEDAQKWGKVWLIHICGHGENNKLTMKIWSGKIS